ncbi:hypothetical protein OIU85_024749 [Salix viminalis]|uniref:Uncharacterized protein n=1 Tax=Salix viminalis TaxID=40686 RepID=A0A9Q0U1H0_SALVM|nr:hypothetical protein OIU85_024749 [Salix viminalis]
MITASCALSTLYGKFPKKSLVLTGTSSVSPSASSADPLILPQQQLQVPQLKQQQQILSAPSMSLQLVKVRELMMGRKMSLQQQQRQPWCKKLAGKVVVTEVVFSVMGMVT